MILQGKTELTSRRKIAGDYNADTEIDKSDAEYLLNYLTNTEINSRDAMETKYNAEINFGTLWCRGGKRFENTGGYT